MCSRVALPPLDTRVPGSIKRNVFWETSLRNQLSTSGTVIVMKHFAANSKVTIQQSIARNVASTGAIKKINV